MSRIKRLIVEAHRRSLWQVILVYVGLSWVVLQVADQLIERLDLPEWVYGLTLILLLVGLPIVVATALVQEGVPGAWKAEERAARDARHERLPSPPFTEAGAMGAGQSPLPREARSGRLGGLFTWRNAIGAGVVATAAWGIAVTGWLVLGSRTDRGPVDVGVSTASGAAIAVLPFRVVGTDLELWREGMVDLLSTNLEGVAGLRKIDPRRILGMWARTVGDGEDAPDSEVVLAVARELGARYALTGSMVGREREVRVAAEVYDLETGDRRGTAQIDGSTDSVLALVDRLSVELLRAGLLPADAELPELDLSRVTTPSLAALKAYLEGEQKYRRSRWDEAIESFERAVEIDSSFALGWYRLALAHSWTGAPEEVLEEYSAKAARFADRLPERERLLLRGSDELLRGELRAVRTLEGLTARYPDDVDGWALLGDAYVHLGGLALAPPDRYRSALRRAIELDPHFGPAYVHLIEDRFFWHDSAGVRRLLDRFRQIDAETPVCGDFEWGYAFLWGDGAAREEARETLRAEGLTRPACLIASIPFAPDLWSGLEEAYGRLRRAGDDRQNPRLLAVAAVRSGHMRVARQALLEGLQDGSRSNAVSLVLLQLTTYEDRASVEPALKVLESDPAPEERFWLGALAAHDGRWEKVEKEIRAIRSAPEEVEGEPGLPRATTLALADALDGYAALRRGEGEVATIALAAVLPRLPGFGSGRFAGALLRLELGGVLFGANRLDEAERYFGSLYAYDWPVVAQSDLYLGRILEARGDPDEARSHYARFAESWAGCDKELAPLRDEAVEAVARLTFPTQGD
ncbi:MAG: tetratricopeptide repeat protein [Gemmatimonadota bacterium]